MKRNSIKRAKLTVASLVILALAALGLVVGNAAALPGDPPIAPVSPADGSNVPAVEEGLKVTYTCPAYRTAEEPLEEEEIEVPEEKEEGGEEEGEGGEEEGGEEEVLPPPAPPVEKLIPVFGNTESYGVNFSTSPTVGANGLLTTSGFGTAGAAEAAAVAGSPNCESELELPTSPNPPALFHERVYWQAHRECEGCPSGFETGPVQSFVVIPNDEEAEITYESHIFGGYLTKVSFAGEAGLKNAKVALQQWNGLEWVTLGEEPGNDFGENSFYVKLGVGHRVLRPVLVGSGITLPLEAKGKSVRKVKKGTKTGVKTGDWAYALKKEREEFPVDFRVTDNGTMLRNLSAPLEAICKTPDNKNRVTIESTSSVKEVPIAPNGQVVAHFTTTGATPTTVTLIGNFFDNRFSGTLTSNFNTNCNGFREFEAVPVAAEPAKPKQK